MANVNDHDDQRMTTVTLYTKQDCCLCDEAQEAIERASHDFDVRLEQVDITSDWSLFERYSERIPVVFVDGVELFEHRVHEDVLRGVLAEGLESLDRAREQERAGA